MNATRHEQAAWVDLWSEARAQGLTDIEATEYADALAKTLYGHTIALRYALVAFWEAIRPAFAWGFFLGAPLGAIAVIVAYILGGAPT